MALYFLRLLLIDTREFSACVRLRLEQLVELGVNGLGIAVLSALNEERHAPGCEQSRARAN